MGVKRNAEFLLDPQCDHHAYFLGLLVTDGTISESTRNRGRVSFELAISDVGVLSELARRMPYRASLHERCRTTNFRANYRSGVLCFFDLGLRRGLADLGYSAGRKSLTVASPSQPFHEIGFWRGVVDGDGSLGTIADGRPCVSLITASQALRDQYIDFVSRVTGCRPNPSRNRRDNVFNIVLYAEAAQQLAAALYTPGTIAIERKVRAAETIKNWHRPSSMLRVTFERRRWLASEDGVVMGGDSLSAIATRLGRTVRSVNIRRWRLRGMALSEHREHSQAHGKQIKG
jgi:hypothetical protein